MCEYGLAEVGGEVKGQRSEENPMSLWGGRESVSSSEMAPLRPEMRPGGRRGSVDEVGGVSFWEVDGPGEAEEVGRAIIGALL